MSHSESESNTIDQQSEVRERVRIAKLRLRNAGLNKKAFTNSSGNVTVQEHISEGVRKTRTDVLAKLLKRGVLQRVHLSAAAEIEYIFNVVGREKFATSSWREYVDEQKRVPDLLGGVGPREERLINTRFAPWLRSLRKQPISAIFDGKEIQYLAAKKIVLAILIGNLGPSQSDELFKIRKGASQRILYQALHRYCVIAGFIGPGSR